MRDGLGEPDGARSVRERALSKVNLALCVLGRRPDGYHEIDTVMAAVEPADELALRLEPGQPPGQLSLEVTGPQAQALARAGVPTAERVSAGPAVDGGEAPGNLVLRAALALARRAGRTPPAVHMRLVKRIPVGAGLGGGSSDAAAALRALNRLWALGLTEAELEAVGAEVGADVPFCVRGGVQRARGLGERLTPLECRLEAACVVAVPEARVATSEAYRLWDRQRGPSAAPDGGGCPDVDALVAALARGELAEVRRRVRNDLAAAACRLSPETARLLSLFEEAGAAGAGVTGSGSAVFALTSPERGPELAEAMRRRAAAAGLAVSVWVSPLPAGDLAARWRPGRTVVQSRLGSRPG